VRQGRDAGPLKPLLRRARDQGRLKSVSKLPASWTSIEKRSTVQLYYAQSLSFTAFLVDRYGLPALIGLLERLDGQTSFEGVFAEAMRRSLEDVELAWKESL